MTTDMITFGDLVEKAPYTDLRHAIQAYRLWLGIWQSTHRFVSSKDSQLKRKEKS